MNPRDELIELLDSLPNLTVVIDGSDDAAQKRGGRWCSYEPAPMTSRQLSKYGPITILHTPPTPHVEAGPVTFGDDGFEVSV